MKTLNLYIKPLLWLIFISNFAMLSAQNTAEKAENLMANYEYSKAIIVYQELLKINNNNAVYYRNIADCYLKVNDTKSAEKYLSKLVILEDASALDILNYGNVLKSNGNYKLAIEQFYRYASLMPEKSKLAESWISSCEQSIKWISNPEFIDISNAQQFNSENSDFGLVPFNDGYFFTSDRKLSGKSYSADEIYGWTGNPYLKMYIIEENSSYDINSFNDLNYKYHNGPGIYSSTEKKYYYTRTKMVKVKKTPINPDPTSWHDNSSAYEYTNRLEIFVADFINGKWQNVKEFPYNNSEFYNVGHPAISSDGSMLYFVSDMPGGYGASDIYYCEKQSDGTWSKPKNAGSKINTEGKEVFPYLSENGDIYFSSDGHPGMGGLDIFYASGSIKSWTNPENLKSPINSPKDDFSIYYTVPQKEGFFASNRDGGMGSDDIYSFKYSPPVNLIVAISTKEKIDDKQPLRELKNVNIKLINTESLSELNLVTDGEGKSFVSGECNSEYNIVATKDDYFTATSSIKTICNTKHDTIFVELVLEKIILNKPIVLRDIYYDFDKWNIRSDAAVELNKLVKILQDNPGISVELGSHTDSRGTAQYNQILSQKRAESAVAYIISNGIDKSRIAAKGYGESVLVNQCSDGVNCTQEEHQMNRRTEFKVTSIKTQALIIHE
jgi:outer membrane protein OmpA-like peptidoglycan-associated protein